MAWINTLSRARPRSFIFLAVAIGTLLGRIRIRGFAIGATACTLIVAVILGQLGTFVIPPLLKSMLFGLFVFTIGYRSGPEFFASLSFQTLAQVVLALVMGACGLIVILIFAYTLHLDPGTAAGLGAGSLTQTSMMGTASGALDAARAAGRPAEATAGQHRGRLRGHLHLRLYSGAALCAARRAVADGRQPQRRSHKTRGRAVGRRSGRSRAISSTGNSRRARTRFRRPPDGR